MVNDSVYVIGSVVTLLIALYIYKTFVIEDFIESPQPTFYDTCFVEGPGGFDLPEGDYTYTQLQAKTKPKLPIITYVTIPVGWRVELFDEDNLKGKSIVLYKTECLNFTKFGNKAVSVRTSRVPIFFGSQDMKGWYKAFDKGLYTTTLLEVMRDKSTQKEPYYNVLSITIPYGFKVTLFAEDGFQGSMLELYGDISSLANVAFDKKTRSFIIEELPTFFTGCGYTNLSLLLSIGRYTLDDLRKLWKQLGVFNDMKGKIASVKVPSNIKVILWETDRFSGRNLTLMQSCECLKSLQFEGLVNSIEVIKTT
jgi:hypothetical protein